MLLRAKFTFLFFWSLTFNVLSQESVNLRLADQFFYNKEYTKALQYYEKVAREKDPGEYYSNYLKTLKELREYKKAEKLIKGFSKEHPNNPKYCVHLVELMKELGNKKEKEAVCESCLVQHVLSYDQIKGLSSALVRIEEWDYALKALHMGQQVLGRSYPLNNERAEVYAAKGDIAAMANEYLGLLAINQGYIQSVQNALQPYVVGKNATLIKQQILKNVQQYPSKTIYSELLIWTQLQLKEYEAALRQTIALDKRKKEGGGKVMTLAKTLEGYKRYALSSRAYQYVLSKGKINVNYTNAKVGLLEVRYKQIVDEGKYTKEDITSLAKQYEEAIEELGTGSGTVTWAVTLLRRYAHIQAFYLHNAEAAISILNQTIDVPGIRQKLLAECKLDLGDVYVFAGDVWEGSLIYSQVEKAYKYEPIGQEAKLRNAKVSYYTGDFKWSQAQLDVLKGATSKLIANDAMYLSILISDAMSIDTNATPLKLFAQADLLAFQNKDSLAIGLLDSIYSFSPFHNIMDDVFYKKYQLMMKKGRYEEAATFLEKIVNEFSTDILADDATFYLAELKEEKLNDKEAAKELYEKVLLNFPASLYTQDARRRYRSLRGDAIN